MMLNSNFLIKY